MRFSKYGWQSIFCELGDKESLEQALCIGPCVDIYFLMDSVLGCMQGCERK